MAGSLSSGIFRKAKLEERMARIQTGERSNSMLAPFWSRGFGRTKPLERQKSMKYKKAIPRAKNKKNENV